MSDSYPSYPYYSEKTECVQVPVAFPPQRQPHQPGLEYLMVPRPIYDNPSYRGGEKLLDRVAIITGGDSGIGRAVGVAFAKEGADIVIVYLNEHPDAEETRSAIEHHGRRCILIAGDLRHESFASRVVRATIDIFGKVDILVNNIAVSYPQNSILDITSEQLIDTFRANMFSYFYMTKATLPYLKPGSSIINTTSATAYGGQKDVIDYSASKSAIVGFTKSLSLSLAGQGIRVNGVAPGPIWTPLIPSSYSAEQASMHGVFTPLKRAGQPFEVAPSYVYLASADSDYVSGQILHVNGGVITGC